jgi:hypothetical protein
MTAQTDTPAVPPITLTRSEYRITATAHGHSRTLAQAIRNQWGWHLPTSRRHQSLRWVSCDDSTVAGAVWELAVRRLAASN